VRGKRWSRRKLEKEDVDEDLSMADLSEDKMPRGDVAAAKTAPTHRVGGQRERERAMLKPMGLRRRNDDFHMSYPNVPHEMEPWNHDLILSE
jgi:hypothetical protein